ncbi:hypothetical protein EDC01DRAFT_728898 [Geopyxis carbonaria]|nr:hypothetical protein EDC01DRAFT_728898 [Geopyxis carbonaria]
MSFLTLFTADAAAAHGHEFTPKILQPSVELSQAPSGVYTVPEVESAMQSTPEPRKALRTKTSYQLAHPPPGTHRHSLKAQKALIVQVQKLSNSSRPIPTLDVLPAAALGSKLKKLHLHCLNHIVGQQDLVLVRSDQYDYDEEEDEEAEEAREVVASISPTTKKLHGDDSRQKTTVISLADGSEWEASPLVSGGYEFVSYDNDGCMRVAKWLPKQPSKRRSYSSRTPSDNEERRFQFSILDSQTRKRPIIAWMSPQKMDILDRYPGHATITSPPMSPAGTPPDSNIGALGSALAMDSFYDETEYSEITESLKFLVIATGIWVALREGFAGNYQSRSEDTSSSMSPASRPSLTSRTSGSVDGRTATQGTVAPDEAARRRLLRHGTMMAHQATTNSISKEKEADELPQRSRSVGAGVRPQRAYSMGRLSRTFGKGTALNLSKFKVEESTSRPVTPRQQSPINNTSYISVTPGLGRTKLFPGHKHTKSISLPNSPAKNVRDSGLEFNSDYEKCHPTKRRRSLRQVVSSIFRRSVK